VTAVVTLDKSDLQKLAGTLPEYLIDEVARGLRGFLDL